MTKFTIIIPMYNVQNYIRQCIESCINQSYRSIEVIIIDDESKDNSLSIAREYEKLDKRVKVISQKNSGVSVARNKGINLASGEWIMFVDGDDWLETDALEKINKELNHKIDILITNFYTNKENREIKDHFFVKENIDFSKIDNINLVKSCICHTKISNKNSSTNVGVPWAKVYKKSFLVDNNCYFKVGLKRMQDMVFNLKAFYNAKNVRCINLLSYHYRINSESATQKFTVDFDTTVQNILCSINDFIKEYNLEDELYNYYDAKAIKLFLEMIRIQYSPNGLMLTNSQKIKELRKKLNSGVFKNHLNLKNQKLLNRKEKILNFLININFVGTVYYLYRLKYLKNFK